MIVICMPHDKGYGLLPTPEVNSPPGVEMVMGAGIELPAQFIVPAFRSWFDDQFRVIPSNVRVSNQGNIPSCVGHATANQKSAQEGVRISPRDIYRQAKRLDGSDDPTSYGTSFVAAQDVLVMNGAAEESLVPDRPTASIADYVSLNDETGEVVLNRALHKGRSPFSVARTQIKQTLMQFAVPVVTGTLWHGADNTIGNDGIMGMANGNVITGHAFACIGWVVLPGHGECLVMLNSWGPNWGHHGMFFVRTSDVINRLYKGYVTLDVVQSLAEMLRKYDGKDLMLENTPDLYRCEYGVLRKYPDEITWWAFGKLFGIDTFVITADDFDVIPKGVPMMISDAPFKTRELVRQIRQHFGAT